MKRIFCLRHVAFEGPGIIEDWAVKRNVSLEVVCLFAGDAFPDPEAVEGLIIMGGPMSVHDEDWVSWLAAEKTFIRKILDSGVPVLGICLGAQLLADALGAKVYKNRDKEIGWWPVEKVGDAVRHPVFSNLPGTFISFHWHGDTFDLPEGAIHGLRSAACENQAFVKGNALALQFHMEMATAGIEAVAERCAAELVTAPWIQPRTELSRHDSMDFNHQALYSLLDEWFCQR